jgi:hypothetical protein
MSDVNIFEQATRKKLRFQLPKGELTIEQLWDLRPVRQGNKIVDELLNYKKELKLKFLQSSLLQEEDEDVSSLTEEEKLDELRLAIVTHILNVKSEEKKAEATKLANKAHNEKIRSIMARKQDDKYEGLSMEELEGLLIK